MDEKDLRTLHILESTEREKPPSQRDLARELNVSLGLINSFFKRLVKKGYFKATHIPKNRIRYLLTPKGAAEKTRLTYAYIQHSYRLYKNSHQKLGRLLRELEKTGVERIVLYGATDLAEIAYLLLSESNIRLVGIIDDASAGIKVAGIKVTASATLNAMIYDRILITSFDPKPAIVEKLMKEGISESEIVTF